MNTTVIQMDKARVGMRLANGMTITDVDVDDETGRYEIILDDGRASVSGSYDTTLTVEA